MGCGSVMDAAGPIIHLKQPSVVRNPPGAQDSAVAGAGRQGMQRPPRARVVGFAHPRGRGPAMHAVRLLAALVVALLVPLLPAAAAAGASAAVYQGDARSVALTPPDIGAGWQLNDEGYRPQLQDEQGISFNNYFAAFIPGSDPGGNPDGLVRVSSIVSVFKGDDDARRFYQTH